MALKIISSLGKSKYSKVRYGFGKPNIDFQPIVLPKGEEKTRLVTVAMAHHLRAASPANSPITLLLLGPSDTIAWSQTKDSYSDDVSVTIWDELAEAMDNDIVLLTLAKTADLSAENMWEVFGLLADNLDENDDVVFDITHSFRTFPYLTLLAASFLRVARHVNVRHIYY